MKEFNIIEMGIKVDFSTSHQTLKSLVSLQLVDIAATQQLVFFLSMIIGSSNKYETKD